MAEQTLREARTFRTPVRRMAPWIILSALVGLGTSLLVGIYWLVQTPTLQVMRLPEGWTARFVASTYGTEHVYVDGPRWQQLALPLVGRQRAQAWGWSVGTFSSAQPALVCWISNKRLPTRTAPRSYPLLLRVANENGSMTPLNVRTDQVRIPAATLHPILLTRYPRRGRWLYLDFLRVEYVPLRPLSRVARVVIPNPTPGPFPQWKPRPLPQAARAGNTTFLLKQFRVGEVLPEEFKPWGDRGSSATSLRFEAQNPWGQDRGWAPVSASFSNAAGDRWKGCAWNVSNEPGEFLLPSSLGREEDAWKIDVHFGLTRGFPAQELWSYRDLPLPPLQEFRNMNRKQVRHGRDVRLLGLVMDAVDKKKKRLGCWFQIRPRRNDDLLTVTSMRDQECRTLEIREPHSPRTGMTMPVAPQPGTDFSLAGFFLDIPSGTRRVDLTVALHHSQRASYLAAPESSAAGVAASSAR